MTKKSKIYMQHTEIKAAKSLAEITQCLVDSGCTGVAMEYDGGKVVSVFFKMMYLDKIVPYQLPCRTKELKNVFWSMGKRINDEQAEMIAWRQMLFWVKAQLALTSTNMVKVYEVFLPYMQVGPKGETLYQMVEYNGLNFTALEYKPS